MRIAGIYLAAGRSSRMGCDKLRLPLGGTPLGSMALRAAVRSRLCAVVAVVREQGVPCWADADLLGVPYGSRWSAVHCPDADRGQAHSLRAGLREVRKRHDPDAVMILLADQPFVTARMLDELILSYERRPAAFVASSYLGQRQPPAILSRSLFADLMALSGDEGARRLLRRRDADGYSLAFRDPAWFYDVDTAEKYEWLQSLRLN
jgi:molybdenum cofactor cytidylyltransferase